MSSVKRKSKKKKKKGWKDFFNIDGSKDKRKKTQPVQTFTEKKRKVKPDLRNLNAKEAEELLSKIPNKAAKDTLDKSIKKTSNLIRLKKRQGRDVEGEKEKLKELKGLKEKL